MVVIDTIAMITAKNPELDAGKIDASKTPQIGAQARIISEELKRLNGLKTGDRKTAVIILNQERAELNQYAGKNYRLPGGDTLKHTSEIIIRLKRLNHSDYIDKMSDGKGFESSAQITKNKFFGRTLHKSTGIYFFQESETKLGLDEAFDLADIARDLQIVKQAGPWITWERKEGEPVRYKGNIAGFIGTITDEQYLELEKQANDRMFEILREKL